MADETEDRNLPSDVLQLGEGHGEGAEDTMPVVDFVDEVMATGEVYQRELLGRAGRNERWIHSEQFDDADDDEDFGFGAWDEDTPRYSRNMLRNFSMTWTSRVLEDRPRAKPWPNEASGGDMAIAEVSEAILQYLENRGDDESLWQKVLQCPQSQPSCDIKTSMDPERGPLSPGSALTYEYGADLYDESGIVMEDGEPMGEVLAEPLSVFDYWTDGAQEVEDSYWVCFRKDRSADDGIQLLLEAGYSEDEARRFAASKEDKTADSPQARKLEDYGKQFEQGRRVTVTEIWHVPCARFPEGFLLTLVGDKVVMNEPFPYASGMLPLLVFKVMDRRGSPYGSTHIDDAVQIQRHFNEAVSIQARRALEMQSTYMEVSSDAIKKQVEQDRSNKIIVNPSMGEKPSLRFIEPPGPSDLLAREEEKAQQQMADAFGVHEVLEGEGISSSVAGKTIAFVNKLSSMKLKEPLSHLEKVVKRLALMRLCLVQQYYDTERIVAICGEHLRDAVMLWLDADLKEMIDIQLELASGETSMRAAAAEQAAVAGAEGVMDPERASEIAETGLPDTVLDAEAGSLVRSQIEALMAGQAVEPDDRVPAPVAIQELTRALSVYGDAPGTDALWDMLQWYKSQQPQEEGPAGPAPPMGEMSAGPGGIPVGGQ